MKNKFIWSVFTLLGLVIVGVTIPAGSQASLAGCPAFNKEVIETNCTPAETITVYSNQDTTTSGAPNYYMDRVILQCDYPQSIENNNSGTEASFVAGVVDDAGYVSPITGEGVVSISGNEHYSDLTEEKVGQCISEIYTACKTLNGCKVLHSFKSVTPRNQGAESKSAPF